jgi:hypothetical protein
VEWSEVKYSSQASIFIIEILLLYVDMNTFKRLFQGCLGTQKDILDETNSTHFRGHESKAPQKMVDLNLEESTNHINIETQYRYMSMSLDGSNTGDRQQICRKMPLEEVPVDGDTWLPLDSSTKFRESDIKCYENPSQSRLSNPPLLDPRPTVISQRPERGGPDHRPTQLNKDIHNLQVQYDALKHAFDVLNMKKGVNQHQRSTSSQKPHLKAGVQNNQLNKSCVPHDRQAAPPFQIASCSRAKHSFRDSKYAKGPKAVVKYVLLPMCWPLTSQLMRNFLFLQSLRLNP